MPTYFKTFVYPCLALGLLIAGCEEKKPAEKKTGPFCLSDSMQRMVTIDSARICSIDDELHLSGEVSFDENKIVKVSCSILALTGTETDISWSSGVRHILVTAIPSP